jgi:hypothetical protein
MSYEKLMPLYGGRLAGLAVVSAESEADARIHGVSRVGDASSHQVHTLDPESAAAVPERLLGRYCSRTEHMITAAARRAGVEACQARAAERAAKLAPIIAELKAAGITRLSGIGLGMTDGHRASSRNDQAPGASAFGRPIRGRQGVFE